MNKLMKNEADKFWEKVEEENYMPKEWTYVPLPEEVLEEMSEIRRKRNGEHNDQANNQEAQSNF